MAIFRETQRRDPLIVAMSGARMGDRVLAILGRDAQAFVDLARKVGLSGRALGLGAPALVGAAEEAAARGGVLVETDALSVPLAVDGPFDVVVVDDRATRGRTGVSASLAPSLLGVLRPGGRAVFLLDGRRGGIGGLVGPKPTDPAPLLATLRAAGFTACRVLADREGILFVEALRAATQG